MTIGISPRRPALTWAIRAAAALTVVGSAAAVTTLTVRADERVATAVIAQDPAAAVTPSTAASAKVAVAPGPPGSALAAPTGTPGAPPVAPGPDQASAAATPGPSGAVPLGTGGAPGNSVPIGTGAAPNGAPHPPNSAVPLGPSAPDGSVALIPASPFAAAPVNTQPPCPLGWPAPAQQGGLASLIGLAPLAGPFSSEAFALGSVYQPILQLVGPVLAEIAPIITANQPLIDPIISRVQAVEAVVLEAILPYYGPYRGQLIAAEGEFAKAVTPILNRAYNSEIASCFVAWQGRLIDQAKGGRITVASLAHPGTLIELGPEQ